MLIRGLIAAPFTPMHKNGDINLAVIDRYVDLLLEQDVHHVFINGTTGEGPSLTLNEKKQLTEKWVSAAKGKLDNVIVQVGSTSIRDSQELARHAQAVGANAIATLPPYYFRPTSIKLLVDCLAEVASAAPSLPLLYYDIPSNTGVQFDMVHMMAEAVQRIPSFAGMKFTSFNLPDLGRCVDKFGDTLSLCYGKDEQLACGFMLGCHAGVGSTFNYAGKMYSKIYKASLAGDYKEATIHQIHSQKFIGALFDEGFDVAVNKAVMEAVTGLPVGPPRLPLCAPSAEKMETIVTRLRSIGFFNQIK